MKNFKRPVFGTAVLALLSLSSVSAFADGAPVNSTAGSKATFLELPNWADGTLTIKDSKVAPQLGIYRSSTGSQGAVFKLDLEKNLLIGESYADSVEGQGNRRNSGPYRATVDHGFSLSPRLSAEMQLRMDGPENKVETYRVRASGLELYQRNRYLTANWKDPKDNVVKAGNITVGQIGVELSEDKRTKTKIQAATITPIKVSVDRAWVNDNRQNSIRLCSAFAPLGVLAGNIETAETPNPYDKQREHVAVELADSKLCLGLGLGQKGGELQVAGTNLVRINPGSNGNQAYETSYEKKSGGNTQVENTLSLTYNSPAISDRKVRFNIGGEAKVISQPAMDVEPIVVGTVAAGGAF